MPCFLDPDARVWSSRAARGFRISSQTAPLVIAALRHYADLALGTPSAYHVERWDRLGQHVEEVVATTSLILVGRRLSVRRSNNIRVLGSPFGKE